MNAGLGSKMIIFWLVSKYDTDHLFMSLPKGDGMKIYLFCLHNVARIFITTNSLTAHNKVFGFDRTDIALLYNCSARNANG